MRLAVPLAALALTGCAYLDQGFPRIDEAGFAVEEAAKDRDVVRRAARELAAAREALAEARAARDSLQDPALVDHLAYLARQKAAIAREMGELAAAREARASR